MTVRIEWESGEASTEGFPGFADSKKNIGSGGTK